MGQLIMNKLEKRQKIIKKFLNEPISDDRVEKVAKDCKVTVTYVNHVYQLWYEGQLENENAIEFYWYHTADQFQNIIVFLMEGGDKKDLKLINKYIALKMLREGMSLKEVSAQTKKTTRLINSYLLSYRKVIESLFNHKCK